jgi:hypothetical protein
VNITGETGLAGLAGTSLNISLPNATYDFVVGTSDSEWTTLPTSQFTVVGIPLLVNTTFVPVVFTVTFDESGLPSGASWYANVTGQTPLSGPAGSSLSLSLFNGSYTDAFSTNEAGWLANGSIGFTVHGAPLVIDVTFSPRDYLVTFTEQGLPTSTGWYVNITGTGGLTASLATSVSSSLTIELANGSYAYSPGTTSKLYFANGAPFVVAGASVAIAVPFTPVLYAVTFSESGLPSGTEWTIIIGSMAVTEAAPASDTFSEMNGTYAFTVSSVAGFTSNVTSGTIHVNGATVSVSIQFSSIVANSPAATPFPWQWVVGGAVAGGLVILLLFLLAYRRRQKKEENPAGPSGSAVSPPPSTPPS